MSKTNTSKVDTKKDDPGKFEPAVVKEGQAYELNAIDEGIEANKNAPTPEAQSEANKFINTAQDERMADYAAEPTGVGSNAAPPSVDPRLDLAHNPGLQAETNGGSGFSQLLDSVQSAVAAGDVTVKDGKLVHSGDSDSKAAVALEGLQNVAEGGTDDPMMWEVVDADGQVVETLSDTDMRIRGTKDGENVRPKS